jgi:hypothetical protein
MSNVLARLTGLERRMDNVEKALWPVPIPHERHDTKERIKEDAPLLPPIEDLIREIVHDEVRSLS